MTRHGRVIAIAIGVALLIGTVTYGQFGGGQGRPRGGGGFGAEPILPNTPYDGKFTFVRMRTVRRWATRRSVCSGRTTTRPANRTS